MNKKYDPEAARVWNVILEKVRELRSSGATLDRIGKILGVGRDTVSRWLREERGGERTPVADVLRYMNALSIHPRDIFGEAAYPPPSMIDINVAKILKGTAEAQAWTYADLASLAGLNEEELTNSLNGKHSFTAEALYHLCKILSQDLSAIVERAATLSKAPTDVDAYKRTAS